MIEFILAGALGAIALIVYLLFRWLRRLSWQLTQLRVERDCEQILRQIGIGGSRPVTTAPSVQPVRRKRHLALYLGGMSAALVRLSDASRQHRPALVASGAATAVAVCGAGLLLASSLTTPPGTPTAPPTSIPSPPFTGAGSGSSGDPRARHQATTTTSAAPSATSSARGGAHTVAMGSGRTPAPRSAQAARATRTGQSTAGTLPPTTRPSSPPGPSTSAASQILCVRARTPAEVRLCFKK